MVRPGRVRRGHSGAPARVRHRTHHAGGMGGGSPRRLMRRRVMRMRTGMLAALLPATVAGQAVPAVRLGTATVRLEAEFTSISSVRELHDGRVILSDPRDRGLVLVDFRTGRVEPIGRKGQGPGEYGLAG